MATQTLKRDEPAVKVLVQSSMKEVRAMTRRDWVPDGNGDVKAVHYVRQFINGFAYMTMEEAKFLVESPQNKKCSAAGEPRYWYPAGFPYPAPLDFEVEKYGVFTDPINAGTVSSANNEAIEGAKIHEEERRLALERIAAEQAKTTAQANAAAQREQREADKTE